MKLPDLFSGPSDYVVLKLPQTVTSLWTDRTGKKYTQTELGDLIGVTNKAVSRWENGESFPDIGVLERLSEILEIKIQDIVVWSNESVCYR